MSVNKTVIIKETDGDYIDSVLKISEAVFGRTKERFILSDSFFRHGILAASFDERGCMTGYAAANIIADECELLSIGVLPEYRGNKAGACLLNHLFTAAAEKGAVVIYLEVRKSNVAALALYGAAGFTGYSERKDYYSDPADDAVLMRKELS